MTKTVEFYFDVGSPTAYLAWTRLPGITAEAGAQLELRPVLLGGIFKATGNRPPAENPAKGQYLFRDLMRFARRHEAPLKFNPYFPVNTLTCMRVLAGVQLHQPEALPACVDALFRAIWVEELDASKDEVLRDVLDRAELDAERLMGWAHDDEVKQRLKDETEAAVQRGLFGLPVMIVDDEMYWGQDRLDFVREHLTE